MTTRKGNPKSEKKIEKIKGSLFVGKDDNGYTRIYFEDKKGKVLVLRDWNGGGYYSDVFLESLNEK